ncbi:hypothetical protein C8Q77DRAFT_312461 [Trametes polyzona]|nr:hypothetical protein C8Q77DRAFT_312461 [Trametes polyzona]
MCVQSVGPLSNPPPPVLPAARAKTRPANIAEYTLALMVAGSQTHTLLGSRRGRARPPHTPASPPPGPACSFGHIREPRAGWGAARHVRLRRRKEDGASIRRICPGSVTPSPARASPLIRPSSRAAGSVSCALRPAADSNTYVRATRAFLRWAGRARARTHAHTDGRLFAIGLYPIGLGVRARTRRAYVGRVLVARPLTILRVRTLHTRSVRTNECHPSPPHQAIVLLCNVPWPHESIRRVRPSASCARPFISRCLPGSSPS